MTSQLRELENRGRALEPPVLSLYVPVAPGKGDRLRRAASRVHSTLSRMDVPAAVRQRAERMVTEADVAGHTLALFVSGEDDGVVSQWLPVEVPLEARTGSVYARWGPIDVAPLWYVAGARERALALYVDRDHWRLFDVQPGEVHEVDGGHRRESAAERDTLQQSKQEHPAYLATRGGSALDDAEQHLAELAHRFHRGAAQRLTACATSSVESVEIVLLGPAASVADVESLLSDEVRRRVAAHLPGLSRPGASPAELHDRVAPVLHSLREERHRELVDRARAAGIAGLAAILRALQQGRLAAIVASWPIAPATVYAHVDTGYLAASEDEAQGIAGDAIRPVALAPALHELLREYGTRVEFVTGAHARRVDDELGGMAGIPRWATARATA